MAPLIDFLLFFVFAFILGKSSVWVIRSTRRISSFFRFSEFTSGFVILAIATSLPELFIGINAAMKKATSLSLGNVIGSNIVNLTLVLGIAVLVGRGINVESKTIRSNSFYMLLISALPILLMLDNVLSRFDGAILVLVFVIYLFKIIGQQSRFEKVINNVKRGEVFNSVALLIFSFVLLIISSNFLVKYAVNIATDISVAPILIGLFLIAVGTSLPELALSVKAALAGHKDLVLGDLIGSVVVNSTLVLGVTALILPITASYALFITSAFFMLVSGLLFMAFVYSGTRITVKEGLFLLLFYVLFIIVEFGVGSV